MSVRQLQREKLRLWLPNVSLLTTEREAQAMATKRQSADDREREAQAMATKRQSADYREREAQGKATKCQSSEYREREAQAKKQCCIKQKSTSSNVLQASQAFIAATKEGPDYTCLCCNRLMHRKTVIEFKKPNTAKHLMTSLYLILE